MTKKKTEPEQGDASLDLLARHGGKQFKTILADPPWQFQNRTGKMAPEHKRLSRYGTMNLADIMALPVGQLADDTSHLYLWVPNALLPEGLRVMEAWGFQYKSNVVWHKIRKDGGPDGRGVGFYFRNVTELVLFGVRGKNARTLAPGRRQVNFLATQKREHSRKPDEFYDIVESCSPGPYPPATPTPRTIDVEVAAGHVEIVGESGITPYKLIDVFQREGVIRATPPERQPAFQALLTELYGR